MSDVPAPDALFAGTAEEYVRHRPPYPAELLAALVDRFALGPGVAVLDLGCGPGVLSLPLADSGAEITGVDPAADMLAAARRRAGERANLRWVHGTAEDAPLPGPYRLAVCGRSFHWLDRARVLARLDRLIEPAGAVVVFREHREPGREAAWRPLLAQLERRWLPDGPRALRRHAEHRGGPDHETVLRASAFARLERIEVEVRRAWTHHGVVGYVRSTSRGKEALAGPQGPPREAELRAALADLGDLDETVTVAAVVARRGAGSTPE